MILILALLAAQAAPALPAAPPATADPTSPLAARYGKCVDRATNDPALGEVEAGRWQREDGGFLAGQCLGIALANQARWPAAAVAFEAAARDAEHAHDARAANDWQQAGNAWLAGGDGAKARSAFDAALAPGTLSGLALGEVHLDRARAGVAAGDPAGARADLDLALADAAADPLAWLLSATLARRAGDLARAHQDIGQALALGGDDPAVSLEAGNIAAASKDATGAREAWRKAAGLHPESPAAKAAAVALAQFDARQ